MEKQENKPSVLIIGMALFSMFFGSGNLIFPLLLGRDSAFDYTMSSLGFLFTAAILPFLGVMAIVKANGSYDTMFRSFLSVKLTKCLIFIIILAWIPFGSAPRCIVLAHVSLETFFAMPDLYIFSLIFLLLSAVLAMNDSVVIKVFGKILTPLLLICLAIIVWKAFSSDLDIAKNTNKLSFFSGAMQGYNTQDLIASVFFSSSIAVMLSKITNDKNKALSITLKSGLFGIGLIVLVYILLISAAAKHSFDLAGKSGIELLSFLAKITMGDELGALAGIVVALACFTTLIALIMVFKDVIREYILGKEHDLKAMIISLIIIYIMSLFKFDGIMKIVSPVMQVVYPILISLVVLFLLKILWQKNKNI